MPLKVNKNKYLARISKHGGKLILRIIHAYFATG